MMKYCIVTPDVKLGKNVKIYSFVNLYGCEIGDNTKIGAFVEIQKNAFIGRDCKIESHVFICEGVHIEDNVFIGHNVTFINTLFPSTCESWKMIPTLVKKGVSIGSSVTILAGITIGENARIGAGAVVTKHVLPYITVVGNPAREIR